MVKAVVGLGNPGARYEHTRHNAGFLVLDLLAHGQGLAFARRRHGALFVEARVADSVVVLIKPQDFMNRSGVAVAAHAAELELGPADLLVVHDDLDLPLARIKLKRGGGTAGHRGLESLVEELGTQAFSRLRVGIGRPPAGVEIVDFVLAAFTSAERAALEPGLRAAVDAIAAWCDLGIEAAMNVVNAPRPVDPDGAAGAC